MSSTFLLELLFSFLHLIVEVFEPLTNRRAFTPLPLSLHERYHSRALFDALDGLQAWEIKDKLGHKCISNTEKYVHWAKELRPEGTERYYTQSVATDEEADRQMALGWQFVFFNPETKRIHLRKTK